MNREYHKWYSHHLQRDMELLIFGHAGQAVLFFPTRMARFYDYENWNVVDALRERIDKGQLQLFCVDSIDNESFYNRQLHPSVRIKRHLQYEAYILNEVIPIMHAKNNGNNLTVAGCSMGAYHAANIALKHPLIFKKAICMSGRYDLTQQIQSFGDLFDGYHDADIYFNMPLQYIANLANGPELTAMQNLEIIFAVGAIDPFLNNNIEFSRLLNDKGIISRLFIWDYYAHKPRYWQQMVKLYF